MIINKKNLTFYLFFLLVILVTSCVSRISRMYEYEYSFSDMRQIDSLIRKNVPKITTDYIFFHRYAHPRYNNNYYYFLKCDKSDQSFVIIQLNRNRIYFFKEYLISSYSFTMENVDKIISDTLSVLPYQTSDEPYISLSGIYNNENFYYEVLYRQIVKHSITEEWIQLLERDLFKMLEADHPSAMLIGNREGINSKNILDALNSVWCK